MLTSTNQYSTREAKYRGVMGYHSLFAKTFTNLYLPLQNMVFDSMIDMVLGMGLGMVASPLMMRVLKNLKQKRRINSILREISELQNT